MFIFLPFAFVRFAFSRISAIELAGTSIWLIMVNHAPPARNIQSLRVLSLALFSLSRLIHSTRVVANARILNRAVYLAGKILARGKFSRYINDHEKRFASPIGQEATDEKSPDCVPFNATRYTCEG